MRIRLAIAAVALQLVILGYIAGQREWVLRTGRSLWLRTAPIDPRDVMRGDYVRLDYEISHVRRALWRDGLTNAAPADQPRHESQVYALLHVSSDGLADVVALSSLKPKADLFLRGKLGPSMGLGDDRTVRYGLEAFFMEQGKARELEDERQGGRR